MVTTPVDIVREEDSAVAFDPDPKLVQAGDVVFFRNFDALAAYVVCCNGRTRRLKPYNGVTASTSGMRPMIQPGLVPYKVFEITAAGEVQIGSGTIDVS